jgi:hypothetical protein
MPVCLLAAAVILLCWPVWSLSHFPAQDSPAHLNVAAILSWHHKVPAFQRYFTIEWNLVGNAMVEALGAVLLRLFDPLLVDRILLTLYLVLWPIGVWYAVRPLTKQAVAIALWSMPFAANEFVHLGFSNFYYGTVFSFFGIGVYLRTRQNRSAWTFLQFFLACGLTYFSHIVAFGGLLAITLALACAESLQLRRKQGQGLQWLSPPAFVIGALVPWLLCSLPWLMHPGTPEHNNVYSRSLLIRLRTVCGMTFAAAYGDWDAQWLVAVVVCFALLLLAAIAAFRRRREIRQTDVLLALALCFAAGVMVCPDSYGESSFILIRIAFLAWQCTFLWIASADWGARTTMIACVLSILLVGAEMGLRYPAYVRWSDRLDEFDRIAAGIPANAVYRYYDIEQPQIRITPTKHAADLISLKPAINLNLYATSSHFMVHYRQEPASYKADYAIVMTEPIPAGSAALTGSYREWLADFDLLDTSRSGRLRLYRRRSGYQPEQR